MPDLTYAIGDIHGCADLLQRLLEQIERRGAGRARCLVFLGDYVDRGPDSARVIEILRDLGEREPEAVTCLMGNHEEMMLNAYRDGLGATAWQENGGGGTLASFGIEDPEDLPHGVLDWLSALPTVHEDSRRYYVHAGFRPGRRGIDPDTRSRLWIREPFLSADYDFGKHVVHGHTPQKSGQPDVRTHRTNLDTAAVRGGALTAGVFTGEDDRAVEFLQVWRTA
ncbi:metallophosphoesterase family protein [Methylobacterium planeticum]|uniref:Serine/threonine protein phosphatase n=1 Tax=Methylobacterium planeticum TaxID=2615211 RepID=A0A6N6MT09_9HYPH|nr:metallophosphoesterase family protein [Methylobacterium planeticum]KAB1072605.1 serine/threonine protein phosphatase [Methylobacterium planeticum]